MVRFRSRIVLAAILACLPATARAADPVEIAPRRLTVTTANGTGVLPYFRSANWDHPRPEATRAVVIFHCDGRNAKSYFRTAESARGLAREQGTGAFIVGPHFLAELKCLGSCRSTTSLRGAIPKIDGFVFNGSPSVLGACS